MRDAPPDRFTPEPLSREQLQALWARLNARYFRSTLPPIHILWSRRLTASAGIFVSHVGPRAPACPAGRGSERRFIRLSAPLLYNQPQEEIVRTLAHEMIHQWQFDVLKRRPNHGADFRRMMAAMNRDGLHITVYHRLDEAVERLTRYTWRCLRCGRHYHRQRRTIRPGRHQCGVCRGPLREVQLAQPNGRQIKGNMKEAPRTKRVIQLEFDFGVL